MKHTLEQLARFLVADVQTIRDQTPVWEEGCTAELGGSTCFSRCDSGLCNACEAENSVTGSKDEVGEHILAMVKLVEEETSSE